MHLDTDTVFLKPYKKIRGFTAQMKKKSLINHMGNLFQILLKNFRFCKKNAYNNNIHLKQ